MPQIVFMLDGQGGTLAFLKENDWATFPAEVHRAAVSAADTAAPEGDQIKPESVTVKGYRNAQVKLHPSDPMATYSFSIWGADQEGPTGTGEDEDSPDAIMDLLDNYVFENQTGRQRRGVSVFGYAYIWVKIDAISAGTIDVEVGVHEYEQANEEEGA